MNVVSYLLTQLAIKRKLAPKFANICHANFGRQGPYFGRRSACKGSAMVPLVNSYRLSTVIMPLTETVWP